MGLVTEIREPNFTLNLPGEWEQGPSEETETLVFREISGMAIVTVTLLGVRPMFAIADQLRLLEDYMLHRQKFESGEAAPIGYTQPVAQQVGDSFEGTWSSENAQDGRITKHRVLLAGPLLADFSFTTAVGAEEYFAEFANAVLGSATATA